jgi:hypothetical protein
VDPDHDRLEGGAVGGTAGAGRRGGQRRAVDVEIETVLRTR